MPRDGCKIDCGRTEEPRDSRGLAAIVGLSNGWNRDIELYAAELHKEDGRKSDWLQIEVYKRSHNFWPFRDVLSLAALWQTSSFPTILDQVPTTQAAYPGPSPRLKISHQALAPRISFRCNFLYMLSNANLQVPRKPQRFPAVCEPLSKV